MCIRDSAAAGSRLTLRTGPSAVEAVRDVARETRADAVFWHAAVDPAGRARDAALLAALRADGLDADAVPGPLLHDPDAVRTGGGTSYRVFTPFSKAFIAALDARPPLPAPPLDGRAPSAWPASVPLGALGLLPAIPWDDGLGEAWTPGERSARARLDGCVRDGLDGYATRRDVPSDDGTSRLSPHLHGGEVAPRTVWHAAAALDAPDRDAFRRELVFREFAHHLLWHFPHTPDAPLRPDYAKIAWRDDPAGLVRWQRGQTGVPIVDAGMRQLWATGWMHNRVRMIVASFLTKDLLVDWRAGARWFWDTLVDADLASNTFGWQWAAGTGADAQPFFRIFNPETQGRRFDAAGDYVRRWVPELARLPDRHLHAPHAAPADVLAAAGVRLGETYPWPVVDLSLIHI